MRWRRLPWGVGVICRPGGLMLRTFFGGSESGDPVHGPGRWDLVQNPLVQIDIARELLHYLGGRCQILRLRASWSLLELSGSISPKMFSVTNRVQTRAFEASPRWFCMTFQPSFVRASTFEKKNEFRFLSNKKTCLLVEQESLRIWKKIIGFQ